MGVFARIQQQLGQRGVVFPLLWVFKKCVYSKRDTLLLTRPMVPFTNRQRTSNVFEVRRFTSDDLPATAAYFSQKTGIFEEILREGIFGLGAFHRKTGDLIGVNFYSPADYYDRHLYRHKFKVEKGQVYQFAAEVAEPFRRSPVIVYILNEAAKHWAAQGYEMLLSATDIKNTTSIEVHFNSGYQESGHGLITRTYFGVFHTATPYSYSEHRLAHLREKYVRRQEKLKAVAIQKPICPNA